MTNYIKVAGLFPPPDYAHAAIVEVGDRIVFTAGAVPLDAAGELVGSNDFIAQTKQVLVNLDAALRAAGSDLESSRTWPGGRASSCAVTSSTRQFM
jgi:enamine deaminase RidA (YjgF/YER057c/UK114 family)